MSERMFQDIPVDPELTALLNKKETPWERWVRRLGEITVLEEQAKAKRKEINDELYATRLTM